MNPVYIIRFLQFDALILIIMGLLAAQDGEVKVFSGIGIALIALIEYLLCQPLWGKKSESQSKDERG